MHLVASVRLSVRPSIHPSVNALMPEQKRARKSHNQSEVFVCVSNNGADAVDRLLIRRKMGVKHRLMDKHGHVLM